MIPDLGTLKSEMMYPVVSVNEGVSYQLF